jgi:Activator of Hsp90 ATPase homolog 1-like protein
MTTRSDVARASVDVLLDAATAFEVFTAEIGEWYVVNEHTVVDHTRTKSMRIEPWVGGRFVDVHDLETGEGIECGRVIVWEPPHRFVFVDERQLDVEVTFDAIAGGCRVTIEERGLDALSPEVATQVRTHSWHRHLPEWFHQYASAIGGDTR